MKSLKVDKLLLTSILILAFGGFFIFTSASLGLLARDGAKFGAVAFNQATGLVIGLLALFVLSKMPNYRFWRKHAFYIFLGAIVLNLLLFIPGLAIHHGGATRWLNLGAFSFQPSEFLKIGFIIYFAAWLGGVKDKVKNFKLGLLPFLVIMGVLSSIILAQSDTDTLIVIFTTGLVMLVVAGAKWRHIFLLGLISAVMLAGVIYMRPYVKQRIMTYLNPAADPLGAGYQIQQSLIAVGSGGLAGRGFGQSIQKFNFLPEPIGDSIFAVSAEEFGFIGSVILIAVFLLFSSRALKVAAKTPDPFGSLVVVGIVTLIIVESFMNIASMLGIIPLSGMPLLFISHGGTALVITLAEAGILLNISKYQRKVA
jgi:cell division protein FtsW